MVANNIVYAQSGGVTAVINASAVGLIQTAAQYPQTFGTVYAAKNGILGALEGDLLNLSQIDSQTIAGLMQTPSGAFGSCRYKLTDDISAYEKLLAQFKAYDIGYFFYNGGGDSQDTAYKIAQFTQAQGFPVTCIGIPKTIDNDLPYTDSSPGFGSVAKYVAISTLEASFDVRSMASSSTKVFILEVMGRHAGWIAAAAGLAGKSLTDPPHLILFPEIPFDEPRFLDKVDATVKKTGYCVIVASEGIRTPSGQFLSETGTFDAFGHAQLGGVAPLLANKIKATLGHKCHFAIADYLQRAARHIASAVDLSQAYALGKAAIDYAAAGENAIMPIIKREQDSPYRWSIDKIPLSAVANQEKKLPPAFIREDQWGISEACRTYLLPLIQGEAYPPYENGLPVYTKIF